MSYVFSDFILGILQYPEFMDIVTGWIHHSLYLVMVFYIIQWEKAGLFAIAGIQEVPTLILAVGRLYKPLRQDLLFGFTFFCTRLVFHFWYGYLVYSAWPEETAFWMVPLIVVPMHLYWFGKWVRQQHKAYQSWRYTLIAQDDPESNGILDPLIDEEVARLDRLTSFDSL